MNDTTRCPECGDVARVEWRCVLESTDGPIEHCRTRCEQGHWFLLPVEMLARHRHGLAAPSTLSRPRPSSERVNRGR
jgi:hypothetical protein